MTRLIFDCHELFSTAELWYMHGQHQIFKCQQPITTRNYRNTKKKIYKSSYLD